MPPVRDLLAVSLPVPTEQFETLFTLRAGRDFCCSVDPNSQVASNTARNHSGAIRVERIVSHGHASPPGFWYDQPEEEWVLLLQGSAQLQFADGQVVDLRPGIAVTIPAHCRHRVAATDPVQVTVWLAIFSTASD